MHINKLNMARRIRKRRRSSTRVGLYSRRVGYKTGFNKSMNNNYRAI